MNIKLADRLVELRKANKLSQEALAEKLGLSRQAISKWERAEASPDTDNLIALAALYGISLDELLGNEVVEEKTTPDPEKVIEQPEKEEKTFTEKQIKGKKNLLKAPLLFLLAVAVYVGGGILLSVIPIIRVMWWAGMWTIFLLVIGFALSSAAMYFENQKIVSIVLSTLAAILYAVVFYVLAGVFLGLWGIAWIVFLAVPAYVYMNIVKK